MELRFKVLGVSDVVPDNVCPVFNVDSSITVWNLDF